MSDDATPRLALPYLAAGQAQKHLTLNEALAALDGLVQTAVESRAVAAEPAAPADGALYLLPAARTGAEWSLHPPGSLLRFEAGGWTRLAAPDGLVALVGDEGRLILRRAGAWVDLADALGALQNLERLGLGTAADAVNPLSAKLNKALFAARGAAEGGDGDLRITLNKEAAGDVLSLLFQTGFSGRAEVGLIGDDRLAVKTSVDGSAWSAALVVDGAGRVTAPALPAFGHYAAAARTTAGPLQNYAARPYGFIRGGCFDPATGVFTAPVAGLYAFHVVGRAMDPVQARAVFSVQVNGVHVDEVAETYGPYQDTGGSILLELAAGATVDLALSYKENTHAVSAFFGGHLVG